MSLSFNFSRLAIVSVSVLTLSVMGGCSNSEKSFSASSQVYSQKANKALVDDDGQYDSYFGSPNTRVYGAAYQPKIQHIVSQPKKRIFKGSAPKRYVVKKGDTLWGISNMFLNNPSYWPEIWDVNQKVKNPHLIYPGDVLYIYEGGKRKVQLTNGSIVEKLVPQMRIERSGEGDPIATLKPFLSWPRVVDIDTFNSAPYIVAGRDAKILLEQGQTVYVKNLADRHKGGRYAIFHKGKMLVDPDTGKDLGYHVDYTGFLEVEQPALNASVASATIEDSKRETKMGDRVLSILDETHVLTAPIRKPRIKVRGTVISLVNANVISGQTMIITINRGASDGIKAGHTLGVYKPGETADDPVNNAKKKYGWQPNTPAQIKLPPTRVATAIVYKVRNDISYALVSESTNVIKDGYKIGNP